MYFFYDLETTDLDRDFGQILQIGIVVTDNNLNIISEKSLRCKCQPRVVPSPQALLITGIGQEDLEGEGATIFEMMREFESILKENKGAITTGGYNSMNFDEGGLRSALHQNLMDPSLMFQCKDKETDRNKRFDVMHLVQACIVYCPEALVLEQKTRHRSPQPSISLGVVARQNGVEFSEDEAHEAVADVKATIAIAQIIRDHAPIVWKQMQKMMTEESVRDFLDSHDAVSYAKGQAGNMKHSIVAPISVNSSYERQQILFDLKSDPSEYFDKSIPELVDLLKKKKTKSKNNPFHQVLIQKQPIFMPLSHTQKDIYPDGLTDIIIEERSKLIRDNLEFQEKISQAAALAETDMEVPLEIEKQLYIDHSEEVENKIQSWRDEFQNGNWDDRLSLIKEFSARFKNELKDNPTLARFPEFGLRIISENAPSYLSPEKNNEIKAEIYNRITNPDAPSKMMTIPKARKMIKTFYNELETGKYPYITKNDEHKLIELLAYYDNIESLYKSEKPGKKHNISLKR